MQSLKNWLFCHCHKNKKWAVWKKFGFLTGYGGKNYKLSNYLMMKNIDTCITNSFLKKQFG